MKPKPKPKKVVHQKDKNIDTTNRTGLVQGYFVINLVHAKDIPKGDANSSDPYIIFEFPDGKKMTSRCIAKNINPVWRDLIVKPYTKTHYGTKGEMEMSVSIYDRDIHEKDDFLGQCKIDL